MYANIPPASRVIYKQDFAGMYQSITQVVYCHFPDYARKGQFGLAGIRSGKSQLHCLSVAMELRPYIPLALEDDAWKEGWNWLLMLGGKVYLVPGDLCSREYLAITRKGLLTPLEANCEGDPKPFYRFCSADHLHYLSA